jgi:17beta-estradiol 17-dehydrogenase / very-long-chain 3-oxoacyl-CoA reductase
MASFVVYVGSFVLVYWFIQLGFWIYNQFIFTSTKIKKLAGTWAVVTGATAGIGEGLAEELASRGLNIVLISRSMEKLDRLSKDLEKDHKVETKCIAIDFAKANNETYENLKKQLQGLKITVLANNVGINTDVPNLFLDVSQEEQDSLIHVNINSALNVTRVVLPGMVENKNGVVINLSSYTGQSPTPFLGVYSATKSFINSWSIALKAEYKSQGIEVMSLLPMYVQSNMTGFKKTSLSVPSARKFAKCVVNSIGNRFLPLGLFF